MAFNKKCSCGREYTTLEAWDALNFVGTMADDAGALEMRNCVCGSTIAVRMTDVVHEVERMMEGLISGQCPV
jgi:hypothetical protein